MPHRLIVGQTRCGKSTLVREILLPIARRAGVGALILDPVGQSWGIGAPWVWQTRDPEAYANRILTATQCVFLLDECSLHVGKSQKIADKLVYCATVSANSGCEGWFIGQRIVHVPTDYRSQCTIGYLFAQPDEDDAKEAVKKFGLDKKYVRIIQQLKKYECLYVEPFEPVKLLQIRLKK